MNLKIILASGTALAMLATAGAAFAGSNQSLIIQNGSDNTANVLQNGEHNLAGTNVYPNNEEKIRQDGNNNSLDIDQEGDHNIVAHGPNYGAMSGIRQRGDQNAITILQQTAVAAWYGGFVSSIDQRALNAVGAANPTNVLSITQTDNSSNDSRNKIGHVDQTNTGDGSSAALKNEMTITQTTPAGPGYKNGNEARYLFQNGTGNTASITQTGIRNIIDRLTQQGSGGSGTPGAGNNATISQTGGNDNLVDTALQQGDGNLLMITQTGTSNQIGALTQQGDGNQAYVTQIGTGNVLVSLLQDINGSTAGGNSASLDFDGNDNGVSLATTNGFSAGGNAEGLGLTQGTALQMGGNNSLTYTVTTSSNLFAFSQTGDNNTITGSVSTGDANEVAVLQDGNSNTANFTQSGGGNNISISQ